MIYDISPQGNMKEAMANIPKGSKIIEKRSNWFLIESSMKWDTVRKHFNGMASVSKRSRKSIL